ncbi:MAG: hypothetical protein IJ859_05930 [Synergistaceae bacterium]|nr:hypothetical protein [Synergistaceae bacterium]
MTTVAAKKTAIFHTAINVSRYSDDLLEAMAEAKRISRDSNVKGYSTMQELKFALETDVIVR